MAILAAYVERLSLQAFGSRLSMRLGPDASLLFAGRVRSWSTNQGARVCISQTTVGCSGPDFEDRAVLGCRMAQCVCGVAWVARRL